jgi:hypothetical protein
MSTIEQPVIAIPQSRTERKGSILAYWLSSTDHKIIGHLYLITAQPACSSTAVPAVAAGVYSMASKR